MEIKTEKPDIREKRINSSLAIGEQKFEWQISPLKPRRLGGYGTFFKCWKRKKEKKNPKTVNLWILYPMTVTLRKIEETKTFS